MLWLLLGQCNGARFSAATIGLQCHRVSVYRAGVLRGERTLVWNLTGHFKHDVVALNLAVGDPGLAASPRLRASEIGAGLLKVEGWRSALATGLTHPLPGHVGGKSHDA